MKPLVRSHFRKTKAETEHFLIRDAINFWLKKKPDIFVLDEKLAKAGTVDVPWNSVTIGAR